MYHYFDIAVNKSTGVPIPGIIVRAYDQSGAQASLFADVNGTPIESVSGIADAAVSDDAGNYSFFIGDGVYDLRIFSGDALVMSFSSVTMKNGTDVDATLTSLKNASIDNVSRIYAGYIYHWIAGDYTGQADDDTIVESNVADITTGAWIKQSLAPTDLEGDTGAGKVGAADGNSVQANIDARTYQIGSAEAADTTAPVVPAAVARIATTEGYTGSGVGAAPYTIADSEPDVTATEKFAVQVREIDGTLMDKWAQLADDLGAVTSSHFRIRGPGYETEDNGHIQDFLNAVFQRRKGGIMMPFTHTATDLIDHSGFAASGVRLVGAPGLSVLQRDQYAIWNHGDWSDVLIEDVGFYSPLANSAPDSGSALLYSRGANIKNVVIRGCDFSIPNAQGNGYTPYTRNAEDGYTATIDGLWVIDCDFHDIGQQACTIMCRADPAAGNHPDFTACERVFFLRNRGKNLGLFGVYGSLLSLDGCGRNFQVDYNTTDNPFDIAIEVVGAWQKGSVNYNRFRNMQGSGRTAHPLSIDNTGSTTLFCSDIDVVGNQCLDAGSSYCYMIGVQNARFRDNVWWSTGAAAANYGAMLFRQCTGIKFSGDKYVSDGKRAFHAETGTANCVWDESCVADGSASTTGDYVVQFSGLGDNAGTVGTTTGNVWNGGVIKRGSTGSWIGQTDGATGNVGAYVRDTPLSLLNTQRSITVVDGGVTLTGEAAMDDRCVLLFQGTLTNQTAVQIPSATLRRGPRQIWNATTGGYALVPRHVGGSESETIANGKRGTVYWDGSTIRTQQFT